MFVFEKFVKMKDIFVGLTLIVHLDLTAHLDKKFIFPQKIENLFIINNRDQTLFCINDKRETLASSWLQEKSHRS